MFSKERCKNRERIKKIKKKKSKKGREKKMETKGKVQMCKEITDIKIA